MSDWEVTFEFKISGHPSVGALHNHSFTNTREEVKGLLSGLSRNACWGPCSEGQHFLDPGVHSCSADYWNGLGIFFDTYDNDGQGQSPLIVAIYNDGTQAYQNHNDGVRQALGNCHVPRLRNPTGVSVC